MPTQTQEEINDLISTENWDLKEKVANLILENNDLRDKIKSHERIGDVCQSNSNLELQLANRKIAEAEKEQKRMEDNYNHAQQTINQLNKTLLDAKKEFEKLRQQQVDAEHMARKIVMLYDENNKFKAEISKLKEQEKSVCEIISNNISDHPEVKKYQAQISRLLNERINFDCQLTNTTNNTRCGNCLACKLKQTEDILTSLEDKLVMTTKECEMLQEMLNASSARNKKEKESLAETIHTFQQRLIRAQKIYDICYEGLTHVVDAGLFMRKSVAQKALEDQGKIK